MTKKKISLIFLIFIVGSLFITTVQGAMPEGHLDVMDKALLKSPTAPLSKLIQEYREDFDACTVLADISVFYYFQGEGLWSGNIGKVYKDTHSTSLCKRMVNLADPTNPRQMACALGVCEHHIVDSTFHNKIVPQVIKKTKLTNELIHIFTEEKINDDLLKIHPELKTRVKNALVNNAPYHKEFFRRALVQEESFSKIDFDALYDTFVAEVSGSDKYSVGFRGFSAVPMSIHLILLILLALNFFSMAFFIKRKNKNIFNKLSIILNIIVILIIITAYVTFFTGNIWKLFQWVSTPVSNLMPVSGYKIAVQSAVDNTVNFLNNGVNYVLTMEDPAGEISLREAGGEGQFFRTIIMIILGALSILFIWLNFRKKKNG